MMKRDKHVLAGVTLFCVVVVGLIIFGVLTHKESGLLTACQGVGDRADYSQDCHEVRFSSAPVLIRAAPNSSEEQIAILKNMVKSFNQQLGFTAFVYDAISPQVTVWFNEAPDRTMPQSGATTSHQLTDDGFAYSATVRVMNIPMTASLYSVLAHELGHVLGLAHDNYAESVMHMPPKGERWYISDYDRKLLRETYK